MMIACATFDTLSFVKRLEAAGVEPKIAEAQMELQAELQAQLLENQTEVEKKLLENQAKAEKQLLEKFAEYQPILDEIKIIKPELVTKRDIAQLENKVDRLESKIENVRNELVIRLGGIIVGSSVVLGAVMPFLINHVH